jgi:TRAP-type transport system small permease protein
MNNFIKTVDKILSIWCISLMGIMTVSIILSVILRYVFNITFVKAEEAITMVFVATTFYGAALGIREFDHIHIAYFRDKVHLTAQRAFDILVQAVIIIVMVFLCKNSLLWIQKVGNIPTPGMQMPAKYLYIMVPVSCVLSIFYALVNILSLFFPVDDPVYGYDRDIFSRDGECCEEDSDDGRSAILLQEDPR